MIQEEESAIAKSQREHVKAVEAKITGGTAHNTHLRSEFPSPSPSDFTQKLQQMMGRPMSQSFVFDLAAPASHFELTPNPLNRLVEYADGFTGNVPRLSLTPAASTSTSLDIDTAEQEKPIFRFGGVTFTR